MQDTADTTLWKKAAPVKTTDSSHE